MRRARNAHRPSIWTRNRVIEFAAMLAVTGVELLCLVPLLLTRGADPPGVAAGVLVASGCALPVQGAWAVWFVVRAGAAIKNDLP